MARAQNKVIAGDYNGREVNGGFGFISLYGGRSVDSISINKDTVEAYELVTDEHRKSAASGAARGLVGGVLLGPVGALAGGLSATNKGVYIVAVQFKDGKKSLLEVNDKLYKMIVTNCFAYSSGSASGQAGVSSGNGGKSLPREDFAIGVNSVDQPMPEYEPRFTVNMNNRRLAIEAVSAIDSYFNDEVDLEHMKRTVEDCSLNVSNEKSGQNNWANVLAITLDHAGTSTRSLALNSKSIKQQVWWNLLGDRNMLIRYYIVDEKINVKRVATKILDVMRGFVNDGADEYVVSANISVYTNTLDIYLERTVEGDSPFNDEDIKRINDLAEKFTKGLTDEDVDFPKEDQQAIVDEVANIVDSLPDAPSFDVCYKAKEAPAQEPEPQEESEPAPDTPKDAAEAAPASSADEIRKYKELLDDGIITQEEFDAKKKQLMGL